MVDFAGPKTENITVLNIRNDHQKINVLTVSDIPNFYLCNFHIVAEGFKKKIEIPCKWCQLYHDKVAQTESLHGALENDGIGFNLWNI